MALKYKDLEAMAARQSEVWAPDGTPNLYAVEKRRRVVSLRTDVIKEVTEHVSPVDRS